MELLTTKFERSDKKMILVALNKGKENVSHEEENEVLSASSSPLHASHWEVA